MAVSTKDIKKLWGLAAGRCSRPDCGEPCIRFLTGDPTVIGEMAHVIARRPDGDPTVIGEMAHVIARRPDGPRGNATAGGDTYENLILLCPTHHTEIDKAPDGTFSAEILFAWKQEHEMRVFEALGTPSFTTRCCLATYVQRLLMQNHMVWKTCGPESDAAQANPLSNLAHIWSLRKLDTVVPNNRRIIKGKGMSLEISGARFGFRLIHYPLSETCINSDNRTCTVSAPRCSTTMWHGSDMNQAKDRHANSLTEALNAGSSRSA